jgi:DHA1 family inner membrane transport protein
MNISAFNLGNAGGAAVGGALMEHGFDYPALTLAGAALTACGIVLALSGNRQDGAKK